MNFDFLNLKFDFLIDSLTFPGWRGELVRESWCASCGGARGSIGMVCFNMYIFNRNGVCLHYSEWSRPKNVKDGAGTLVDDAKMMFGLLFSLKNVCTAIDPTR